MPVHFPSPSGTGFVIQLPLFPLYLRQPSWCVEHAEELRCQEKTPMSIFHPRVLCAGTVNSRDELLFCLLDLRVL